MNIMKTIINRLLFAFRRCLFIGIAIILLSGCSKSNENVIHIWHQMLYENRQALRDVCDKYEDLHPHIKIQLTYRETEELRSNFQSSAIGGSGPELIYGPSDQIGPFAVMGIIKPLDRLFPKSFFDQFVSNAIIKFQNKTWMVGDGVGNHLMVIYNKDMISSPPTDTDDLINIGKSLTKDTDGDGVIDQYGLVWNFTEPFFYVPWIGGFGEWFINDDGTPNLDTEANRNAFSFIKSLRDEHGIIPKECDYETANALFKTGKAAMIINGDWSWGDYKGRIDFGIAPLPKVSRTGKYPTPLVSTKGYSINRNTSGETLMHTIELLKYLTSPEVQSYYLNRLNTQPSSLAVLDASVVKTNELLMENAGIIEHGRPMPVVPELRAIWDALRGEYQSVLAGTKAPSSAAADSQEKALEQIQIMNHVISPGIQEKIIKIIFFIGVLIFGRMIWKKKKIILKSYQENKFAYWMLFPALIGIMAVILFPFGYNLVISVSNFSLRSFKDWQIVGFHHFLNVLGDIKFYSLFVKTIVWTFVNISFHVTLGVCLAVLINRTLPAKKSLRTMLIIPWALPQYIAALTWRGMFNQEYGSVNLILNKFLSVSPIQWLSQPMEAFSACIITNIWLGFPFMMVVALGGLQSIPNEMYEASKVDGASRWQQFLKITIPMIKPVMIPAIILGSIWTFNNINVVWLVSNGGEPSDLTHILVSYVYKAAFNLYRYGYAAALSMIIFLILASFTLLFMKKFKLESVT